MSAHLYLLDDDGEPVLASSKEWTKAFTKSMRRVALTKLGDYEVSTVFLGVDYSFMGAYPILFETMTFQDGMEPSEINCNRYGTRVEALLGHEETCTQVFGWLTPMQKAAHRIQKVLDEGK